MVWGNTTVEYEIKDARIIAAINGGGAMIERGDFLLIEGREAIQWGDTDDDKPPTLDYICAFSVIGAPDPDASESVEGRIVIDGEGDGGRIEVRGDGYIGYDENGHVSGWFILPPRIIIDRLPRSSDPDGKPELSRAEWLAHMEVTRPRTSAEYDRALRWREGVGLDDDD